MRHRFLEVADDTDMRRQYADAMERHGLDSNRARLIRLQLHLADLPGGIDHASWVPLRSSIEDLLLAHNAGWIRAQFADVNRPVFHRGFIEEVTVPVHVLLNPRSRKQLFDAAPVQHLNIVDVLQEDDLWPVLTMEEMKQLISLGLDGQGITDETIRHLGESKLKGLRWLSLSHNEISEVGIRHLHEISQDNEVLRMLEFVELSGNQVDPAESFEEDQGIVIGRIQHPLAEFLGSPRWLHREVVAGRVAYPSRFQYWRRETRLMAIGAQ